MEKREKKSLATKYPYFSSHANTIVVSGKDVYIAGDEFDDEDGITRSYATVWKNGIPMHIGLQDSNMIKGLFISGNDVYAAGSSIHSSTYFAAAYWKNGIRTFITSANQSQANSIYVLGKDVYTAGFINTKGVPDGGEAVYWKNNEINYLDKGTTAKAIYINSLLLFLFTCNVPAEKNKKLPKNNFRILCNSLNFLQLLILKYAV